MDKESKELEVLRMVFAGMKEKYFTFDIDGDGTITNEEFRQVLEDMVGEPCPEEDWKEFVGKVDYDNSGTISFEEFLYALFLWFADDEEEEFEDDEKDEVDMAFALLKNRFKEVDLDGDDTISRSEFKKILDKVEPERKVQDSLVTKIYSEIEGASETKNISFKQYLYGMYLFVTNNQFH
eukprot:TRINITY_DN21441_c0_g1_i1.p1 TRINITY_DN21441_c0_g1~~TRINITY_DN21441_c0_g1_i1.p1  ORF type:complete len:180 (-),score=37.10 TRINITY_DN21441_c0_g1_i1:18-557(-)